MANHRHTVRNDRLHEQLDAATKLGERKIPTAMTWPLAQLKRALREKAEAFEDAQQMLLDQYTEGERDAGGKLTKPAIVYAKNPDGSAKFKVDDKGEPTTEREIDQGKIQLTNLVEHGRELRTLQRQTAELSVPHLSWAQLEGKVATIESNIVEPLMEYFDDPPKDEPARPAAATAKKKAEPPAT